MWGGGRCEGGLVVRVGSVEGDGGAERSWWWVLLEHRRTYSLHGVKVWCTVGCIISSSRNNLLVIVNLHVVAGVRLHVQTYHSTM